MTGENRYALPYEHYLKECAGQRLVLSHCPECGNWQIPAFFTCRSCGGTDLQAEPVSGRGRIASFTEVLRGSNSFFAERTPYVICLVDLEEGPRMMMQARGEVRIDAPVIIGFTMDTPDGQPVPVATVEPSDAVR